MSIEIDTSSAINSVAWARPPEASGFGFSVTGGNIAHAPAQSGVYEMITFCPHFLVNALKIHRFDRMA
ncbi:MAG: hypothetical protein ABNH26_11150 [Celeribacter sp.]|jgi:hypothetical protein